MQNLRKKNHNFPFLQVHTLDRVFQCPQCEKGFKEQRTLRLHLKIHNAEYPEQCSVCQKVFRTKWQLKQHQMDHGGERPYPCPECSFTCKTKQQLNEHRRKHSVSTSYYFRRQKITMNPDANRRKLMMMLVLPTNQTQMTMYETFIKYFLLFLYVVVYV